MKLTICLAAGIILDFMFGDPYWLPHPVRWIGGWVSWLEKRLRRYVPATKKGELFGGGFLAAATVIVFTVLPGILLWAAFTLHDLAGIVLGSIMCYQMLAAKCLKIESMRVYKALKEGEREQARQAVAMIVGRDTKELVEEQIAMAAVETIAENTSDGVIAPLLFMAVGGPVLGFFYKAVNTMDSMIGYQNKTYQYFGRAAARLDDLCNYIPSRLSALLMTAASFLLGLFPDKAFRFDGKNAWNIYKRDRRNHKSPNSAQTESVCAGALGVRLAGDAYYSGHLVKKPFIGDRKRAVVPEDIPRANRLLYMAAVLAALASVSARCLLLYII